MLTVLWWIAVAAGVGLVLWLAMVAGETIADRWRAHRAARIEAAAAQATRAVQDIALEAQVRIVAAMAEARARRQRGGW